MDEEVDRTLWGELESESEEEEEEEAEESDEEEEEDQEGAIDTSGLVTPSEGLATPSGFSSVPAGLETPDMIELRKKKIESEMEKYWEQKLIINNVMLDLLIYFLFLKAMRRLNCIRSCLRKEQNESVKR